MSKELVIGSNRHETKVAILEDDQLVEIYFQRENEYSLAGSIHKGRVTRVLPGMQSAFVDLGLERDTFLYVSDFFEENEDIEPFEDKPRGRGFDRPVRGVDRENAAAVSEPVGAPPEPSVSVTPSGEGMPQAGPNGTSTGAAERERDFRGDRRGRRSRRRRVRDRGFPESKYAQPVPVRGAEMREPSVEEGEEERGDEGVIVLPGESLAKYRNAGTALNATRESEPRATEPTPDDLSDAAEADAELEAEAEEIELVDKVLSHHDDDPSPLAEEEKLAEVKQDAPAPSFVVDDIEAEEVEDAETLAPPDFEDDGPEPGEDVVDGHAADVEEIENEDFDGASESDVQPVSETPGGDESARAGDVQARESGAPGERRTAEVRDPGDRYPHRVSRRMRRRRGNRFPNHVSGSDRGGAGAAGTAPAAVRETERETSERREEVGGQRPDRAMPSIAELLKPGQEIIVQIAKEPLGQKGARITSHIALPGRFVVFMPSVNHVGVSRRIESDEERQRLKRILQKHRTSAGGGFIVRTAGEGIPEEEIAADMDFLYNLWADIREKAEKKRAPALLHYDLDVVERILRDQLTGDFKAIWVDNEEMYESVVSFMQRFQPALVSRVKLYTRARPIFDEFNITQELEKALRPKVWLKSGGYIVLNQTEALVAIDINTGKYVGKSHRLEDTIVKTNTEAIKEIVRQIRLRDLGGIIVVDFIDMDERKNRQKVMQALEEAMRADRAPFKILQFNDFGLVAITRKRVKQSLERTLCSPCPYCDGAGYVRSVQTVIGEILAEAQRVAKALDGKDAVLRVHPDVARVLKANTNKYLEEIEEILARPVLVKGDATMHHEKFDLV